MKINTPDFQHFLLETRHTKLHLRTNIQPMQRTEIYRFNNVKYMC